MTESVLTQQSFTGLRGTLRFDEPMANHTSWRVGGKADIYFIPADREDLLVFISQVPQSMPVVWVGLGSNLLVRDGGIRGVVIATHKGLSNVRQVGEKQIFAEAGVPSAKVARFAMKQKLTGGEFLAGIPGTLGGALAMNAGAFGSETWEVVESVEVVNRIGETVVLPANRINVGYRTVKLPVEGWFIGATLSLEPDAKNMGKAHIRSLLEKRSSSQPIQSANAGSVFRNPKGDFAARLIESAGLKGKQCGGAQVSAQHANFILNNERARASDIEGLIEQVRAKVQSVHGVILETEVKIIGENI